MARLIPPWPISPPLRAGSRARSATPTWKGSARSCSRKQFTLRRRTLSIGPARNGTNAVQPSRVGQASRSLSRPAANLTSSLRTRSPRAYGRRSRLTLIDCIRPAPFTILDGCSTSSPFVRLERRPISSRTAELRKFQLLQYLSALIATGVPADGMTSFAAVTTPEMVESRANVLV